MHNYHGVDISNTFKCVVQPTVCHFYQDLENRTELFIAKTNQRSTKFFAAASKTFTLHCTSHIKRMTCSAHEKDMLKGQSKKRIPILHTHNTKMEKTFLTFRTNLHSKNKVAYSFRLQKHTANLDWKIELKTR